MAVDIVLEIELDDGVSVTIDAVGFEWGLARDVSASGTGGGAARPVFEDLLVEARPSKASPALFAACAGGRRAETAVLRCRRSGEKRLELLRIELKDVVVTSYEVDAASGTPLDRLALAYGQARLAYTPVKGGRSQPTVEAGWDLTRNVAV